MLFLVPFSALERCLYVECLYDGTDKMSNGVTLSFGQTMSISYGASCSLSSLAIQTYPFTYRKLSVSQESLLPKNCYSTLLGTKRLCFD